MKTLRDEKGKLVGLVIESGDVAYLRNQHGHVRGQHLKSADKTFDGQGHYAGNGDQLLRMLGK